MSIIVSGKHTDVGGNLKTHIETSLTNLVKHYMQDIIEASVVIEKSTYQFRIDISVHLSWNFVIRSHAEDSDAYRCCDLALEKLEARLKRYKTRLRDKKRNKEGELLKAHQYIINTQEEDNAEETPLIIAEMASEIPILSVGDAVMKMDLTDVPVMMFKNQKNGQFNVIYKRQDGHIGWIAPQKNSPT